MNLYACYFSNSIRIKSLKELYLSAFCIELIVRNVLGGNNVIKTNESAASVRENTHGHIDLITPNGTNIDVKKTTAQYPNSISIKIDEISYASNKEHYIVFGIIVTRDNLDYVCLITPEEVYNYRNESVSNSQYVVISTDDIYDYSYYRKQITGELDDAYKIFKKLDDSISEKDNEQTIINKINNAYSQINSLKNFVIQPRYV